MLDMQTVMRFFLLFTDLEDREAERWLSLCEAESAHLESRLREEKKASVPGNMERLCAAAAACAYYSYAMLHAAGAQEAIRVGDVSLQGKAGGEARELANEIRARFLEQVSDLLEPETVVFRQVS